MFTDIRYLMLLRLVEGLEILQQFFFFFSIFICLYLQASKTFFYKKEKSGRQVLKHVY